MSVINYRKFIFLSIISFIVLLSSLEISSGQPVLQETTFIKPTIKARDTIHFKINIYEYQPRGTYSIVLGVPVFEDFSIENSELHLDPERYETGYATLEVYRASYLSDENDNNKVSTYAFQLEFDREIPSSMNLTLEFDITGLHSSERAMFPFDKYNSEIRLIFPLSDNAMLQSWVSECETEDKTIKIIFPLSQQELNVKNPDEMEYGGIIYSDFHAIRKWQWASVNIRFDTEFIYYLSTLLPLSVFLILLFIMSISPILLKELRDRIHYVAIMGTAACLIFLTSLVNYNQMLPTGVTKSLGHVFIIFGLFALALNFLSSLLLARMGAKYSLAASFFFIGGLFLVTFGEFYHRIAKDKLFFQIAILIFVLAWAYLLYNLPRYVSRGKKIIKQYRRKLQNPLRKLKERFNFKRLLNT